MILISLRNQRLLERLDYQTMPGTKASGQRNSGYSGF